MTSERTIPHLRDVFNLGGGYTNNNVHRHPDYYNSSAQPSHPSIRNDVDYHRGIQHHQPHHPHQSQLYNPQQQQQQQSTLLPPPPIELAANRHAQTASRKTKRGDNYKTLTPGDVKTLERHLSMKKTIRKKIMRDLQQAFVDDPNEFACEHAGSDRMRSELNMEALRFGDAGHNQQSDNFLVMLRDDPSGYRGGGGASSAAASGTRHNNNGYAQQSAAPIMGNMRSPAGREYDYDAVVATSAPAMAAAAATAVGGAREEKPSFWKRLTMKNKSSKR